MKCVALFFGFWLACASLCWSATSSSGEIVADAGSTVPQLPSPTLSVTLDKFKQALQQLKNETASLKQNLQQATEALALSEQQLETLQRQLDAALATQAELKRSLQSSKDSSQILSVSLQQAQTAQRHERIRWLIVALGTAASAFLLGLALS